VVNNFDAIPDRGSFRDTATAYTTIVTIHSIKMIALVRTRGGVIRSDVVLSSR